MVGRNGQLVRVALKRGAVEVIERRRGQDETRRKGMRPCNRCEDVLLTLPIVPPRSLLIGIVRNLVVVEANARLESYLVFWVGIENQRGECPSSVSLVVQVHIRGRL